MIKSSLRLKTPLYCYFKLVLRNYLQKNLFTLKYTLKVISNSHALPAGAHTAESTHRRDHEEAPTQTAENCAVRVLLPPRGSEVPFRAQPPALTYQRLSGYLPRKPHTQPARDCAVRILPYPRRHGHPAEHSPERSCYRRLGV